LKLPVAPNNGDRHFSKLFNVEETKGIIHSRIYPARDNISALIRCNVIIKNYVNRKITSYIYLLIFTISLWLHVKRFITLKHEKGKCEKIFFAGITDQDYPCQHIDQWPRKTRESTIALTTKKKKACVRIKYVKTDRYLTYGHSRINMKLYVDLFDWPFPLSLTRSWVNNCSAVSHGTLY
jgi:hypothetical protein